jgi:type I restriction enzyme S subunit
MEATASWPVVQLGELASCVLGKMLDKAKHRKGTERPYLRNVNVRWDGFDLSDLRTMFFEDHELDRYGTRVGDVLVCEGGEPGRAAVWRSEEPMLLQKAIHRIRPSKQVLPEWIALNLRYDAYSGGLEPYFTGVTIRHLTGKALCKYAIPLPTPDVQRMVLDRVASLVRIVEQLEARERVRRALGSRLTTSALEALTTADGPKEFEAAWNRVSANWDALASDASSIPVLREAVLGLAMGGRLVPQDPLDTPASIAVAQATGDMSWRLPERTSKEKLDPTIEALAGHDPLPHGWSEPRLNDIIQLINGRAYAQPELLDSGTPVIRIQNLNGGSSWYYSDLALPERQYCDRGDLLFAWSASFGPYIWSGGRAIYHYHIWKLNLSAAVDKKFMYYALLHLTDVVRAKSHGLAMLHMTKSQMERWPIPLPPLAEQRRIASRLDSLMVSLDRLEAALKARDAAAQRFSKALAQELAA